MICRFILGHLYIHFLDTHIYITIPPVFSSTKNSPQAPWLCAYRGFRQPAGGHPLTKDAGAAGENESLPLEQECEYDQEIERVCKALTTSLHIGPLLKWFWPAPLHVVQREHRYSLADALRRSAVCCNIMHSVPGLPSATGPAWSWVSLVYSPLDSCSEQSP